MPEGKTLTLRDYQIERARSEYVQAMAVGRILHLDLVRDHGPIDDVLRYGARGLGKGLVRVGIVRATPDENGSYFTGGELNVSEVPRWFSVRGVPVVRVALRPPVL